MRVLVILTVAGCLGGCGGDAQPPSPSDGDPLADGPQVAVDEIMAASDLAEGDSALTITAVPEAPPAAGAARRVNLGAVLRRIANGGLTPPCSPAPQVERLQSSAACALIDRGGQYTSELRVTFSSCTMPGGGQLDGTVRIQVAKALAEGATCTPAGIAVDVRHDVTFDLKLSGTDGSLKLDGQGSTRFARGRDKSPFQREVTLSQERTLTNAKGRVVSAQSLTGRATSRPDATSTPPALVVDGSFSASFQLARLTETTTVTELRRIAGCCHPVGGQEETRISTASGASTTRTVAFGPECGQATLDGQARTLDACP